MPLSQLPGMTGEQVIELLGAPPFRRGETAVELWRYRSESCVLHLFLYRAGGALRVRHAEVRSLPAPGATTDSVMETGAAANACLAKLAAARTSPTS